MFGCLRWFSLVFVERNEASLIKSRLWAYVASLTFPGESGKFAATLQQLLFMGRGFAQCTLRSRRLHQETRWSDNRCPISFLWWYSCVHVGWVVQIYFKYATILIFYHGRARLLGSPNIRRYHATRKTPQHNITMSQSQPPNQSTASLKDTANVCMETLLPSLSINRFIS